MELEKDEINTSRVYDEVPVGLKKNQFLDEFPQGFIIEL